jgi:hypothetical protein
MRVARQGGSDLFENHTIAPSKINDLRLVLPNKSEFP